MVLDDASVWEYKIGKVNTMLKSPNGEKTIVHNSKIGFVIKDENDYGEVYNKYEITPFQIKKYIVNKVLNSGKKEQFKI